jgi:hypothetical protein
MTLAAQLGSADKKDPFGNKRFIYRVSLSCCGDQDKEARQSTHKIRKEFNMACPNVGVEEVPEKVVEYGPQSRCGPERDAHFVHTCPAYTLIYPAHHVPVKKEGFELEREVHKLDVMKQKYKCKIRKVTMPPEEGGESYYVGECVEDGPATKHSKISDYSEKACT